MCNSPDQKTGKALKELSRSLQDLYKNIRTTKSVQQVVGTSLNKLKQNVSELQKDTEECKEAIDKMDRETHK